MIKSMTIAVALTLTAWLPGPIDTASNTRPLRVMALGDSITYGLGDPNCGPTRTGCAGWRLPFQWRMHDAGTAVDMVGSRRSGTSWDRDVEGWPGFTTGRLALNAQGWAAAAQPDVVLVMAGTNDARHNIAPRYVAERLTLMIRAIRWGMPRTRIVLATITRTALPHLNTRIAAYNREIPKVAAAQGVALVDLADVGTPAQLADGLHPNRAGYLELGGRWAAAVRRLTAG